MIDKPHMPDTSPTPRVATTRMTIFGAVAIVGTLVAQPLLDWRLAILIGFDAGAIVFITSCMQLVVRSTPELMRVRAAADDDNRWVLLAISAVVSAVILAAVGSELAAGKLPAIERFPLIISTIVLAWVFANLVYALHYAHLHYGDDEGCDAKGLCFPGTPDPVLWDFIYFSFTMGLAFATSDVEIESTAIRRTAVFHCMIAFFFNIGVIGFTINLLAGMHG